MIKSIKHKGLRLFFETGNAKGLPVKQTKRVADILKALDGAKAPADMDLPGFRLHPLPKTHPGFWACDASANYRVLFKFDDAGNAVEVTIKDYH